MVRTLTLLLALLFVACGDSPSPTDAGFSDLGATDAGAMDAGPRDAGADDQGAPIDLGPGGCFVDCDCSQGLACIGNRCIAATLPVYCCDKPGCPGSSSCTTATGASSTCDANATACTTAGGTCVVQTSPCPANHSASALSCGPTRALRCCEPD